MSTVNYLCHSSFKIVSNQGSIIYIDPFVDDGSFDEPCDILLVTHEHFDHNQTQIVSKKESCTEIHPADSLVNGVYKSFQIGDVSIQAVPAYNANHPANECVGYVIGLESKKLYFAGDTSTTEAMTGTLPSMNLDYAFLPCDGVFNMDVAEASECAKKIGAKHTVPIHTTPVSSAADCGYDMDKARAFDCPGKLIVKPSETITL